MIALDALVDAIVKTAARHGYTLTVLSIAIVVPGVEYSRLRQLVQPSWVLEMPDAIMSFEGQIGELHWSAGIYLEEAKGQYYPPLNEDSRLRPMAEDLNNLFFGYGIVFDLCSISLAISEREYDEAFDYDGPPLDAPPRRAQIEDPQHSSVLEVSLGRSVEEGELDANLENIHAKEWELLQFKKKGLWQDSPAVDESLLLYESELIKFLWQQVPAELSQLIRQCSDAVKRDPEHHLLPGKRQQIYDLIASYPSGDNALKWLAAFTVIRTVHYWHEETPEMFRPFMLLRLAQNALEGKADVVQMAQTAHAARSYYEGLEGTELDARVIYAGMAAAEALLCVAGLFRWAEISINENVMDDTLDSLSSDVAKWAVSAYAGMPKHLEVEESNREKRLEFWIWWLEEVIPAAWSTVAA